MRYIAGCSAFFVVALVHSGGAFAQGAVYRKVVERGHDVSLGFYASINPDCSSRGYASVAVLNPPQGGQVFSEHKKDYASFVPTNPRSACNKLRLPGTRVYYHAKPTFVGVDNFGLQIVLESGDVYNYNLEVEVR